MTRSATTAFLSRRHAMNPPKMTLPLVAVLLSLLSHPPMTAFANGDGYSITPHYATTAHGDGYSVAAGGCPECQSCPHCSSDACNACQEDRWGLRISALSFRRPGYESIPSPILGDFGSSSLDFDPGYSAGYEFELYRNLGEHWRVTARYLGVDLSANDQLDRLPDGQFTMNSELRTFDLMFRRSMWKWFNPSIGYRTVEADASERQYRQINPTLVNMVDLRLSNDMAGFQIGADGEILQFKRLSVDYYANYAALDNTASGAAFIDVGGGPSGVQFSRSNNVNLGEFGIGSDLQLTDSLAARFGYRVLLLDGIADPSGDDSIPFNGFDFGLRFTW